MLLMMCRFVVIFLLFAVWNLLYYFIKKSVIIFFFKGMPLFQHNSISSASCLQNGAPPPLMNWARSQPQMTPGQGGTSFSSQRGATPNPHPHPHHTPEAMQTSWYVHYIFYKSPQPPSNPPPPKKKLKWKRGINQEMLRYDWGNFMKG